MSARARLLRLPGRAGTRAGRSLFRRARPVRTGRRCGGAAVRTERAWPAPEPGVKVDGGCRRRSGAEAVGIATRVDTPPTSTCQASVGFVARRAARWWRARPGGRGTPGAEAPRVRRRESRRERRQGGGWRASSERSWSPAHWLRRRARSTSPSPGRRDGRSRTWGSPLMLWRLVSRRLRQASTRARRFGCGSRASRAAGVAYRPGGLWSAAWRPACVRCETFAP